MFYVNEKDQSTFDYDAYTSNCQKKYGLTPRYDWAFTTFGGKNYTKEYK